ncbi:MAG: HD domain-containing protein [Bacteroidota bacterium]|jgi:phosphonate degradation associated HDIG domain protein|nr:HDIG domain-containing protein [Flammeovirgaceae bacterium]MCZ8071522.1 HDIG domain-containing protein [Cytophagales bacterium]
MNAVEKQSTINEVFELYENFGVSEYVGEPVSLIEHMSQSAQLAMQTGQDDEVILAAFFHDIGHMCALKNETNSMGIYGAKSHEKIGADFLRAKGFSEKIARLVENHVQAKRYLTHKYPDYYNNLSEASKKTLEYQGGKMTEEEAHQFENDPLFATSILMRQWDEEAKLENIALIDIKKIKSKALAALDSNS